MRALPIAGILLLLSSELCHAQKPLSGEPDEGGIGGTGHGFGTTQKPDLIERPEMPERIERIEPMERIDPPDFEHLDPTNVDTGVEIDPPTVDD